ncbi:MAG: hypothetical protein KAS66_07485 [Candidatus Omnitrophica bacterium]|nr:hypothetical protein [Candidatus Omnitrophota bacterium]
MMKIYVASSWRNYRQPNVVNNLRGAGHEVYDFRQPGEGDNGFHWSEIDIDWQNWTPEQYITNLSNPIAEDGYKKDYNAILWADACVLVMPCGRSAHLEAGYFVGANKKLIILIDDGEPELMYKLADNVCITTDEVIDMLR